MSAAATTAPAFSGELTRPGLGRLTRVELRKMIDTRAGFWLLLTVAALTVLAVFLLILVGDASDHDLRDMLSVAVAPSSVLLPVVGILLVSSEWSQRTALITFTLVPQRPRVLGAKLAAGSCSRSASSSRRR
jgi:ABC-2 type transport system permease protein